MIHLCYLCIYVALTFCYTLHCLKNTRLGAKRGGQQQKKLLWKNGYPKFSADTVIGY